MQSVMDMVSDVISTSSGRNSTLVSTPKTAQIKALSTNSTFSTPLSPDDGADVATLQKADECDRLIKRLCDLRGEDGFPRKQMLATRRRMAPVHIDTDIEYLREQIAQLEKAQ